MSGIMLWERHSQQSCNCLLVLVAKNCTSTGGKFKLAHSLYNYYVLVDHLKCLPKSKEIKVGPILRHHIPSPSFTKYDLQLILRVAQC